MEEQVFFSQVQERFLEEKKIQSHSPRTIELYTRELNYFSIWLQSEGLATVDSINALVLKNWFLSLGTHRNPGGVHVNYRILKTLFNFYNYDYEPVNWKNPIQKIKLKPNRTPPLDEIPIEDVQKLLNVCYGRNELRDKAIIKTLIDTGVRGSELVALNIQDINLETGSVQVLHGKGNQYRLVWLGKTGIRAIKDYLKTREPIQSSDPLFTTDEQKRLQFFGLRMLVTRLCNRAGIKKFGIHAFRRCFALTLYRKTHDVFMVSKLLGHSSVAVTIRYLHIGNSDLKDAHDKASPADLLE